MKKTVLIVEDNELNMKLFNDLLKAHGYATLKTGNGIEALELARAHKRSHLDGHPASRSLRPRGHEVAEGGRRPQGHPGHRGHRLRHEGRRGAHPRGRLRGLSVEADLGREVPRDRAHLSRRVRPS